MPKVTTVTPNGPVIKALRERAGLSRKQLGTRIGRWQQSIRRLEETTDPASRLFICQVAKVLQVDADALISPDEADVSEEEDAA